MKNAVEDKWLLLVKAKTKTVSTKSEPITNLLQGLVNNLFHMLFFCILFPNSLAYLFSSYPGLGLTLHTHTHTLSLSSRVARRDYMTKRCSNQKENETGKRARGMTRISPSKDDAPNRKIYQIKFGVAGGTLIKTFPFSESSEKMFLQRGFVPHTPAPP